MKTYFSKFYAKAFFPPHSNEIVFETKVKLEVAIVFHERPEWSIVSCDQDVSKTFKAPSFHVALDVKISSPLSPL